MKILLCTDGSKTVLKAVNLLIRMNLLENVQLTLLGSLDEKAPTAQIQKSFEQIESALGGAQPGWKRVVVRGSFVKNIEQAARSEKFDLVDTLNSWEYIHYCLFLAGYRQITN